MKFLPLPCAILLLITFSSCKKDYWCECTTVDAADGSVYSTGGQAITAKEADAKDQCEESEASDNAFYNPEYTTTCELREYDN